MYIEDNNTYVFTGKVLCVGVYI